MNRLLAAAVFSAAMLTVPHIASQTTAPATKSTVANGVTVRVSPARVSADAETWAFSVVLDTHTQELADDLTKTVVLVTDDGRQFRPSSWNGPGAGGHHREGTLAFPAPKPYPAWVEMRMQRPGEAEARTYRWTLQ